MGHSAENTGVDINTFSQTSEYQALLSADVLNLIAYRSGILKVIWREGLSEQGLWRSIRVKV